MSLTRRSLLALLPFGATIARAADAAAAPAKAAPERLMMRITDIDRATGTVTFITWREYNPLGRYGDASEIPGTASGPIRLAASPR